MENPAQNFVPETKEEMKKHEPNILPNNSSQEEQKASEVVKSLKTNEIEDKKIEVEKEIDENNNKQIEELKDNLKKKDEIDEVNSQQAKNNERENIQGKANKETESKEQIDEKGKANEKSSNFLSNVSIIINQNDEHKNMLENSFIDDEIRELTKQLKEITKKTTEEKEIKLKDDKEIKVEENALKDTNQKKSHDYFIPLKDDPKFKNKVQILEIEKSLEEIKEFAIENGVANKFKFAEIKHDDVIDFSDESILAFFKSLNFILSENSKKRLNLLYFCIKHGFHILIPGPTGTGKTYLSEAICNLLKKNMIKYNCSENTKFPNLKFTCQGDKDKFAGIKYIKGPLLKALTTKNTAFLMDEANLSPIEVLQALEAVIDNGYLVYEDKGKLIRVDVPKDFCCILTLNPSKGKFSGTRQELPESFKNKFISIEFPEMKKEELYAITDGASKAFGVDKKVENCNQFIDDFISFHMEWSKNEKIQDDVACLVIRDILAVLHIILEGEDPTETIMNIYGARYIEDIKKEMKDVLSKYSSFKNYNVNYEKITKNFPKDCFMNKNTLELIYTCIFSLRHGRHPIIAGNIGTGKKMLACKLADYFNEHIAEKNSDNNEEYDKASSNNMNTSTNISVKSKNNKNDDTTEYIVYCTKSSKVEDLMGKPKVSNNKNEDLIQWQDGPLIKAVREGKPLILLGIHELQSSVLEYMNDLLDRKYDGKQRFLNNPNNPNEPYIPIHKNFRLICTTLLSDINKLSPAFATRMDIKILNDQLEGISEEELLSLIKICMNNTKAEIISYGEEIKKRIKELNDEMQMNLTRIETSKLSISSKNLVTVDGNKNTEKSRKDSVDSKKSIKSNDSKKSNKSNESIKSNKSKNSNLSRKSSQSKKSKKSSSSMDSKKSDKSGKSKHSRKSSNSKDSKNSDISKHSRRSKNSRKNSDISEDENSENNSTKKKKSRRSSIDSKNGKKEQDSEDENLSEELESDSNETEIKILEGILSKFDEKRINEIVNNGDLLLELKQNYDKYNSENVIKMNMTLLDKYIRSTILLLYKLKYETFTDIKTIAKLVYDLLFSDQNSVVIDEKIKNYILSEILINDPINKYFYKGIKKIENYMLSLYLYCAMNIPIYVFGPPGVGKTAGAECLARIRTQIEQLEGNYKKYAFNSATNPSDIFGAETLMDGQVKLIDGPLTESALSGQTFIADEMNLSSNNTMMSLIPVFNTIRNRLIYFPGLQTPIKINPNFWFGAFQNYEGTAGRNATPHELSLKLVRLDYPTVEVEDIKNICIRIRNSIYENMQMNISDDEILQLATFMIKLNKRREDGNLASAEAWSIRNLENIINRMAEQQKCQNPTYKRIQYENCALYVNVLFYVLSYIDFESVDESFDEILNLITECFQLSQKESEELRKTYFSKPEISYNDSDKFFSLKKNDVVIKFRNSKIGNNINFLNKVSSLLNTLFVCLLCADTEPILLIGPSGYKTYLVQLLINNIKIITLNEESSIDALLGSTGFFNLEEVKTFYLSLICDVCIKNQKLLYLQQLKEGKLNIKDLKTRIKNFFSEDNSNCGRRIVFKDMVYRILDKLLKVMNNKNINSDNILNNIKLEFKPGLFTSAILSGDSLNLRNFDKIPTTTLERFNELFTGMKTLTLNEDKFNTITTPKNKLICDTVDFIRFFATSLTKNFSEAVLSRWTVINTKEYEFEELEEVLKICSGEKNLDTVTQNDIKYLIEVSRFFKNTSNKTVSIKLLINTIELFHDMNKNLGEFKEEDKDEKEKLYYINRQFIYYVTLRSIIEQNKDEENSLENEINDKLYEYLFTSNKERQIQIEIPKGKSPFSFGNKNNLNGMKSIITNAFIPCIKNDYPKLKPAFTTKFVEMLNIIHLGLSLNCTTVIEGQIGQGKQTAIKFLSEILGFKSLVIQLSSSNKEEDLLGKVIVDKDKKTNNTVIKINETDLLKVLKNQGKTDEKYLIVFNDLQNASDAVKEKIANICDRHQKHVLLPDGNTINKPELNIICVINTETNSDIRSKLPSPLLYSTIYYKIGDIPEEDVENVTYSIFNKYFSNDYSEKEAKEFIEKFNRVNKILKDVKSRQLLTFNDINNYAKLRSATYNSFDEKLIDSMIFYYRTQEEEIIKKLKSDLKIDAFNFIPSFEYNPCFTELSIKSNLDNKEPLVLKVINKDKININEITRKLNTLTSQQKQCLLFLSCAWLTKSKVIIKGDTASGKTHCAILFSEMLGADLLTYQMNQDITPSIFTGQSILEEDLNSEEIKQIKLYLSEINDLKPKNINVIDLIPNDPKAWVPSIFNKFFEILDKINEDKKFENRKSLIEIKSKINSIISPQGRFKETESQTSYGLINGSWFLYDDIQFSTPDLLSIMTPLCSDKPSLNLFNAKDSPKFSMEIEENSMNNVKLINPNFNLIMTFNQKYCKNYQGLDPILENKCLSFNLPSNDYNYESCAQIYYGGLTNSNIDPETANQLGGKLANIHMFAKKKSLENKEFFEGDAIFTSRTINRAVKYISNKIKEVTEKGKDINLSNIIKIAIEKLYVRPYIEQGFINNGEKSYQYIYRENILNNFKKEIDNYKKNSTDNNFDENRKLLEQLRDIQIAVTESKPKDFNFKEFVENSLQIKLGSIYYILRHIDSTLMFIYGSKNTLKSDLLDEYHQISIIYKLLKNIMKYGSSIGQSKNDKKLSDSELLEIEELKWPILRLKLLERLIKNGILPQLLKREYASRATEEEDDILENKLCINILNLISEMVEKPEMSSFINLIKYIYDQSKSIEEIKRYIETFTPFYKFRSTKLDEISAWLPLIIKCIICKQSFKIVFNDNIEFKFDGLDGKENFKKLYFYFTSNELILSKSSKYEISLNKDYKMVFDEDSKEKHIYRFFHIIRKVLDEQKLNDKRLEKIIKDCRDREDFTISKKNANEIDIRYRFFKISKLFNLPNSNKIDSVGKFWMIIYNMSDKSVQSLCKLLTSYEITIFNLFLHFYNNNEEKNIDKFIEFIKSLDFYTDNLVILNLEADEKYISQKLRKFEKSKNEEDGNNLEIFCSSILKKEKEKFKAINYYTEEIETGNIIKLYESWIQKIEDAFIADKETKEKNKLKNQFKDLYDNIRKIKNIKKFKNLLSYQKSLMEQVNLSIQNDNFDKEEYEMYNNKYEQLKKTSNNLGSDTHNEEYSVKWPILFKDKNIEKSKTASFIELLIWYSKIKNTIDNIKINNDNKDKKFKYILELQEFEEMKYASDLIISTDELTEEEFNLIYSTLNSHYIMKMIKAHLEQYLYNCIPEINKILDNNLLIDDEKIINKNDYYFIHEIGKEINNKFMIQIPKFKPKDIVLLYMQFGAKNKKSREYEPSEGPIIKQIKYSRILDVLMEQKNNILNDNFGKKTAETTAKEIIYTLCKNTFKIENSFDDFSNDIINILSQLSEKLNNENNFKNSQKNKEFIDIFKITLDISKKIDNLISGNEIKLNFEDAKFLEDDKWNLDIDYISRYPHLIYILNKYEGIYDDIKELYKINIFKPEEDKIPFWLILLRLLSNKNNIEVDYNIESNILSKKISEKESIYLRKKLIDFKTNNNSQIDAKWLNLCIKNLTNNNLYSKKVRNIFENLLYQIQNIPSLKKEILNIIEENMISYNNKIFDKYFDNQLEDIFDTILTEDDDIIKIIYDPKKLYNDKINEKINKIIDDLLNSQEYKKLVEFYKGEQNHEKKIGDNESKPFILFCNSLKSEIDETLKTIDENYKIALEEQNQKKADEKVNDIIKSVKKLNEKIEDIELFISEKNDNNENKQGNENSLNNKLKDNLNSKDKNNLSKIYEEFNKFNNLIQEFQKIFVKIEKNDKFIVSKKKKLLNYLYVNIKLENRKDVYYDYERKEAILFNEGKVNLNINTNWLKDLNIILDLNKDNEYSFYLPVDDIFQITNIFNIKNNNNEEIKLNAMTESKYGTYLYYIKNYKNTNFFYKRKIILNLTKGTLNKYEENDENIKINKEKIKKEIEESSSKIDSKKTLNFGTGTYIKDSKLYTLLEKFNTCNINFSKSVNEIGKNRKIKCDDILKNITSLFNEQKKISKYLKCNCSDGTQFPKISSKLEDIQNYFNQLISLFKNFDSYIRTHLIDFMDSYEKDENSLNSMLKNIQIKAPISSFIPKINLDSINPDSTHLLTLIISEENGKVSCSQNDIPLNFGSYVSSLINGDFSVYILSIINEKLYPTIDFPIGDNGLPNTKFDKIINIKNEIEPNELFSINIKIPKKNEEDDEEFDIKFKLKLGNTNLSELELPCNFKFILSSLKVKIECIDYTLIIKDDELFLGTKSLEENETIRFKVKFLNDDIKTDFKVSYKGNDENEAKEPKLVKDKNDFDLIISKEYENIDITEQRFNLKIFSAKLYIHITNEIFVPININAKIEPFNFKITAYDFYKTDNAIENELKAFYGDEQIKRPQKLFFKIKMPEKKKKYIGKIKLSYNKYEIRITDKSIKDEFEISSSTKFNITTEIQKQLAYDIELFIEININSFIQKFRVIFQYAPPIIRDGYKINFEYYPTQIPLYTYKKNNEGKFKLIQHNNTSIIDDPKSNIFVTPFEISEIDPIVQWAENIELAIDKEDNLFYVLNDVGNLEIVKSNFSKYQYSTIEDSTGYFFGEIYYYYETKSFPLFGVYKGVWYPTLNYFKLPYDKIAIGIYNYDDVKNENPKNFINMFLRNLQNTFTMKSIGSLFIKEKVINNIEDILEKFPDEIKSQIYKDIRLLPLSEEVKIKSKEVGGLDKLYKKEPSLFKGTIFEILKSNKKEKINILKNNIIYSLWIILVNRYEDLKSNGFRDLILLTEENEQRFKEKVKEMREEYFCKKKEPKIHDNFGLKDELYITNKFRESSEKENKKFLKNNEKNNFSTIKFIHYNNKYIYTEFEKDELNKTESSIIISKDNAKTASSMILTSDINLPELQRPEKDLTLDKLIKFYNDAIKYTRILPIFIRSSLKNSDEENKKKAEKCFSLLINTYKAFKPEKKNSYKDSSFLSYYINEFIYSFEKMISKLKKAGFKIYGLDIGSIEEEENANEILKIPEYEILDEKSNYWNIYKKKDFNEVNKPFYDKNTYNQVLNDNKEILKTNDYDTNLYNDKIEIIKNIIEERKEMQPDPIKPQFPSKNPQRPNTDNQINIQGSKPININNNINNNNNNKNDDTDDFNPFSQGQENFDTSTCVKIIVNDNSKASVSNNQGQGKQEQNQDIPVMKLNSNAINKMTVNPKAFGNKNMLFNEKDGIEKSIIKIKAMDENEKFSYDYKQFDNYYPKAFESVKSDEITIKDLVDSSKYISKIFIKFFSEYDIPFLNEGVAILIDCSGYINKDNKLFNMHLICGLTEGLHSIGIPYSVALISDENFKRIIKRYDTPHNIYELQKIYECYMIPRYRTNLAKSIHFAIDNMKYDANLAGVGKVNSNTAFFIFTDGMDENLYFGKDFKQYLFNNPNFSFGFIFMKSSLLSEDYKLILKDLWNNFIKDTNGSISRIQIETTENKYDYGKIESITKMFINILERNIEEQNYKLGSYPVEKPIFEIPNKGEFESDTLNFIRDSLINDYSSHNEIFYNISQIRYNKLKADKLDSNIYNNKIGKIINCKVANSIKSEFSKFTNSFIIPKNKVNISLLDQIFLPNKASTMILSTTGTEIDIPAFIKYLFENNPNPMIYLEKKGGFTKHYSVSIIIDSSFSCLNKFSFPHTIQTIRTLISSIASINIPAVDIIVATTNNPIVICSDIASNKILGKSSILPSLFKVLSKPCLKANLLSALKVAKDLQKIGSKDTTKYMFVLTDGLYQQNELDLIKNRIFDCMQTSSLIGIGVGFYPLKIKKLFVQNIYAPNPNKLFNGIAISTGKSNDKYTSTMPYLDIVPLKDDKFEAIIEELSKTDNPINKELIKELENIEIEMDAFSDFYNAEKEQFDDSGALMNPTGKNTSMYAEGFLEGHEILFVCLYNCDMNPNEDPHTNYKYLYETSPKAYYHFNQCVEYYKAKVKLVLDYEDAINEITKPWDKDPKKGKYYAVWIVCGPPYPMLPNNPNKKPNPYLLGQFMKVLNIYNENGGSVVFLTESDPLFYQANLFLRDLYLYDKKGNKVKVDLQLEGEHKGDTILKGDKTGELKSAGLFNKSSQSFKNLTRSSLSHNLVSYYEGYTIDFADYNKVMNSPFYPFARDSDGGVAGFFYPADEYGRGDIIFNCSYTSLYFTKKDNDGTYRYYENIIAWTARPEIHLKYDQCLIKDYRPKKVNFNIDYNNKWNEFKELPKKEITEQDLKTMKTIFCVDASGSVGGSTTFHNVTRKIFNNFYKNGDLIYLWGSSYKKLNYSDFRKWNDNKDSGLGGTASELIADIIIQERNYGLDHLIIITDGSVNSNSIDNSDKKMKNNNIHFKFVSTYIIGSGGDRSVGAPYCRGDPSVTYLYRSESSFEKLASLSHAEIQLLNSFTQIRSYSEFNSKAEDLRKVLEAQMYGRNSDSNLISKLNTLKSNILNQSLSQQQKDDFMNKYNILYQICNGALRGGGSLKFGAKLLNS